METEALIRKILLSKKAEDLFSRTNFRKEYLQLVKLLHPDLCSHPKANEAVSRLNLFREELEEWGRMEDDAGSISILNDNTIGIKGDSVLLRRSLENYRKLMSLKDEASNHFKRYLPVHMELKDDSLIISANERIVPLTRLTLDQRHVAWLLSRMLELTAWLHQAGYCHAGINPESIFVVPKTHGIICVSFYHLAKMKQPLASISGRYLDWYPPLIFKEKKAISYLDLALAQRTAIYVLGDRSGNGIKLKRTCNERLIDFLIAPHHEAYSTYDEYRKLVRTIFGKPKFHHLNI
jgi:hypothetical protein